MSGVIKYLYPHSLSYHETSFINEELRAMPALASKILDLRKGSGKRQAV